MRLSRVIIERNWAAENMLRIRLTFSRILDRKDRLRILGLALLVLIGSALDVLGIGLIIPLVLALSDPEALIGHDLSGPVLRVVGVSEPQRLIPLFGLALVLVFFARNLFLVVQWRILYGFIYGRMSSVAKQLFKGYMLAPYSFHLQQNSAVLIRNTNTEVQRLFQGVIQPIIMLASDLFLTVGILTLLFLVQPYITLTVFFYAGIGGFNSELTGEAGAQ